MKLYRVYSGCPSKEYFAIQFYLFFGCLDICFWFEENYVECKHVQINWKPYCERKFHIHKISFFLFIFLIFITGCQQQPVYDRVHCFISVADTGYPNERLLECDGMPPEIILEACTIPVDP